MENFVKLTYSEFLDKVKNGKNFAKPDSRSTTQNDSYSKDFAGCSLQEAIDYGSYGWKDSKAIKDIAFELDSLIPVTELRNSFIYDISGDEADVGRFLSNEPENMIQYTIEEDKNNKLVHIVCNTTFSSSVSKSIIYNRGASLVTLINKLEDLGYRVKLDLVVSITSDYKEMSDSFTVLIEVKDYSELLDLDRVAYCLCHRSFFRRLVFCLLEQQSLEAVEQFGFHSNGGYGYPFDNTDNFSYTLYLESLSSTRQVNYDTLEKCVLQIQRQIKEVIAKKH